MKTAYTIAYSYTGYVARQLGCYHSAEYVIQEACITLLRNEHKVANVSEMERLHYVLRIIRSRMIDHIRKNKRRQIVTYEVFDMLENDYNISAPNVFEACSNGNAEHRLELKEVLLQLQQINPDYAKSLLASAYGYSANEMKKGFNLSNINTALGRVRYGRAALNKMDL